VWTIFKICFMLITIATCKLAIEIWPFFFIQLLLVCFFFFFLCTLVIMHGQRFRGMLGFEWIFVVSLLYFCLIFVILLIITCLICNVFLQSICFNFDSLDSFLFNSTLNIHYEKIKVIGLAIEILSYNEHLQLMLSIQLWVLLNKL
jgi:hypothetical protein